MARILLTGYTEVEALVEAINCGLVHRYISKPWNNDDLKLEVSRALEEYENNKKNYALKVANERLQMRFKEMKLGVANALDAVLRIKDEYSSEHAARVSRHAAKIAGQMGISDIDLEDLTLAAALHRLGHLATRDDLLWKAGSLATEERAIHREHSERGARILAMVPELRNVADLVRFHHENFDGSGSPRGLEGQQIPLACRIIRVADVYDLLTKPRALSASVSHEEAMRLLWKLAGIKFDPAVVKFASNLDLSAPAASESEASEQDWMLDKPGDIGSDLVESSSW
jgi:response regulator RpfG family c-di-GMP phosphodiesterase